MSETNNNVDGFHRTKKRCLESSRWFLSSLKKSGIPELRWRASCGRWNLVEASRCCSAAVQQTTSSVTREDETSAGGAEFEATGKKIPRSVNNAIRFNHLPGAVVAFSQFPEHPLPRLVRGKVASDNGSPGYVQQNCGVITWADRLLSPRLRPT